MPAVATTRSLPLSRPASSPVASAWASLVAAVTLVLEVWREARAAEFEAHQRLPFVDW